ncbi:hypothetical protein B0H13DRAFT_2376323 [Mycena leptocephala]|nr:hypothetical protein B0H13DRAFT_2376323 [Mycena leptocephala]
MRPHNALLAQNSLFLRPHAPFCISPLRYTFARPFAPPPRISHPLAAIPIFPACPLAFPHARSHFCCALAVSRMTARCFLRARSPHCVLAVSRTPARCLVLPPPPRASSSASPRSTSPGWASLSEAPNAIKTGYCWDQ